MLIELTAKGVIGVGTDGRRLAKMEGPVATVGGDPADAQPIVPSRSMQLVERCLASAETPVHIAVHPAEILIRTGDNSLGSSG